MDFGMAIAQRLLVMPINGNAKHRGLTVSLQEFWMVTACPMPPSGP